MAELPTDAADTAPDDRHGRSQAVHAALLFATLTIAVCGLIYELIAGTLSSYLLGDSVYQFSLVIGVFMAAMGLGAWLSRFFHEHLADAFVGVQLTLAVIGGSSAPLLFFSYVALDNYQAMLLMVLVTTGTLVGLEIPLVLRILREHHSLRVNVSNVLSLDYAGALIAALLFPLVLVPQLGLMRTSLLFGFLNAAVAALAAYVFAPYLAKRRNISIAVATVLIGLAVSFFAVERFEKIMESRLYSGEVILSESTRYQRLVLTRRSGVTNFFINGGLQFSSIDEHRYHEALVHPAMGAAERREHILIIGGGDGLAAREVLKYADVRTLTLVDLDARITQLFSEHPDLRTLNAASLTDNRVNVVNDDAAQFLSASESLYDVIIIDLPDPHDIALSRLYTRHFYTMVSARLSAGGIVVTQATSPYYAREAFWSIERTLSTTPVHAVDGTSKNLDATLQTHPYHAYVPTFGDWGFVLAGRRRPQWTPALLPKGLRFLDSVTFTSLDKFAPDISKIDVEANTLHTHQLARYYETGWSRWYR